MRTSKFQLVVIPALIALLGAACDSRSPTAPDAPPSGVSVSTLLGIVTDAQTLQPVIGATVTARVTGVTRTVITNSAGGYRMEALPEGNAELTVKLDGFEPYVRGVVLDRPEVQADVVFVPLVTNPPPPEVVYTTVTGIITSRLSNAAIENATVTVRLENGVTLTATTLRDGSFVLSMVPVGMAVVLRVDAQNHISEEQQTTVTMNMQVTISLSRLT
jgi:hypothetical protein